MPDRVAEHHTFTDGLTGRAFVLVVGPTMSDTGVVHGHAGTCDVLADVSPELDSTYCPACGWQGRISGAWFMDMWRDAHPDERVAVRRDDLGVILGYRDGSKDIAMKNLDTDYREQEG